MKKLISTLIITSALIGFGLTNSASAGYVIVDGYFKSNGTYVAPHVRSTPDAYKFNNLNW